MCHLTVVLSVLSALLVRNVNAARILCVYPTPSFSHQIVYRSLTEALAKRGHDVVVITTHPFPPGESPANLTEIDVYEIVQGLYKEAFTNFYHATNDKIRIISLYLKLFTNIFEKLLQSKPVKDLIKSGRDRFDLLLLESNVISTVGLLNVFDALAIQTSTFGPMPESYAFFGAPIQPVLYPTAGQTRVHNLTLSAAINTLYRIAIHKYAMNSHEQDNNAMLQRNLGQNILPLNKLYERVQLFFQTVYPIWMCNPPVPRGIVYLGGMHQKPPKILPQKLQAFLDASNHGVIYVSFGSNVKLSLLSQEKINMMARVFSNLPYDVLWKNDLNIKIETPKNVYISTWFPQSDLLYHPKIKLFITQGGLQSTEEAIAAGVPLIGIPILGDQWMNTEHYVHYGIGMQLDWNMLSEEELIRSIETVIGDKSYKENMVRFGNMLNDQPQSPLERAVWWIEYVLKHGGAQHLLPASADMSWLQYFEIELIVIVVLGTLFSFSVVTLIIFRLAQCICRGRKHKRHSKII